MRPRKHAVRKNLAGMAALAAMGLLFSLTFAAWPDTYAQYTDTRSTGLEVSAVTAPGILKTCEVIGADPGAILVQKAEGSGADPVIFFSMEGEAAEYVLHINPVRLESPEPRIIPVSVNVSLDQYLHLITRQDQFITGTIKFKYLNEYIDEGREIKFSRQYLMKRFLEISLNSARGREQDKSVNSCLGEAAADIMMNGVWDELQWSSADGILSRPRLGSDQERVVDAAAPGITRYMDELYSSYTSSVEQMKEKKGLLDEMTEKYEALQKKIQSLIGRNEELNEEVWNLKEQLKSRQTPQETEVTGPVEPTDTSEQEAAEPPEPPGTAEQELTDPDGSTNIPNLEMTEPTESANTSETEAVPAPSFDQP